MTNYSKKITAYLPPDMIASIKQAAAQKGNMHYSEIITSKLNDAFAEFKDIKTYSELQKSGKYKKLLSSFKPSKIGRPWNTETVPKVGVTLFLSKLLTEKISLFARRFEFSKSSVIELAIRFANKDLNNGKPLNIKINDSDKMLLKELLEKTGASELSELLYVCNYSWIQKEIRKEIGELHKHNA